MTDIVKLNQWIEEHGLKHKFLAKKLGLTPYGVSLRLKNENDFKANQIRVFRDLGMTKKDEEEIFFIKK